VAPVRKVARKVQNPARMHRPVCSILGGLETATARPAFGSSARAEDATAHAPASARSTVLGQRGKAAASSTLREAAAGGDRPQRPQRARWWLRLGALGVGDKVEAWQRYCWWLCAAVCSAPTWTSSRW
jgi:hypothetical protein